MRRKTRWILRFSKVKWFLSKIPFLGKRMFPCGPAFFRKGFSGNKIFGKDFRKVKNAKIMVIGLAKSGNTWLALLLADCLDLPLILPWDDMAKSGASITHEKIYPGIILRKDILFTAYIMRDLRDVFVSQYFYSQTDYYRENVDRSCFYSDIESFYFEYFLTRMIPSHDVNNHAEDYVRHGAPLIKYEDLWDNPTDQLQKLFLRWGLDVSKEKIQAAVDKNQIDRLSKTGKKAWKQIPTTHFRKGGYGGYKNSLPKKIIKDMNYRFGNYLRRWGYELDQI